MYNFFRLAGFPFKDINHQSPQNLFCKLSIFTYTAASLYPKNRLEIPP